MSSDGDWLSRCFSQVASAIGATIELAAPGRQAAYHVDRIVMRARRINELLAESSPDISKVQQENAHLAGDWAFGNVVSIVGAFWSHRGLARMKSDVQQAVQQLGQASIDLGATLTHPPIDLSVARSQAASLLAAAEELRTRAYAYEDRHGKTP